MGDLWWLQGLLESLCLHVQWQGTGTGGEGGHSRWCEHAHLQGPDALFNFFALSNITGNMSSARYQPPIGYICSIFY